MIRGTDNRALGYFLEPAWVLWSCGRHPAVEYRSGRRV